MIKKLIGVFLFLVIAKGAFASIPAEDVIMTDGKNLEEAFQNVDERLSQLEQKSKSTKWVCVSACSFLTNVTSEGSTVIEAYRNLEAACRKTNENAHLTDFALGRNCVRD